MEIDSFYKDNDMSFGMDGRISFANEYSNATGGDSRATQVDKWYPISEDCMELDNTIASIDAEIANNGVKLANPSTKRGEKRVLNDYQKVLSSQKKKLEDKYRTLNCKINKQQSEDTAFLSQLKESVSSATASGASNTSASSESKKTMLYVGIGIGVLALVGTIVYIIKKK
jgi:hypothetical protein